ncbi:hypothetical protein [Bacteroides sedimenti]|uniref:Lipoprotein n=1 Tax=Bacteroides sedimenti TaxID=2136147 RepID=A0ABM8IFJ9_9BACE
MKTKHIALFILCICALLTSCKVGNYSQERGLPDQAYLLFVANEAYEGEVQVTVDNETTFNAKVIKEKKGTIKRDLYAIAKGKRYIKVSYNGKVIYEREIFVSAQETKKIQLP